MSLGKNTLFFTSLKVHRESPLSYRSASLEYRSTA